MPVDVKIFSITGDCSNSGNGGFTLLVETIYPPYTVQYISPTSIATETGNTQYYTKTNLNHGVYSIYIYDQVDNPALYPTLPSSGYFSNASYIDVTVCSSSTITLSTQIPNSCDLNNGVLNLSIPNTPSYDLGKVSALSPISTSPYQTVNFYKNNSVLFSEIISGNSMTYTGLTPGLYYAEVYNNQSCYGRSNSVLLENTSSFDFGLFVVNTPSCLIRQGKLIVTGLTGYAPYTYEWSGSSIFYTTVIPTGDTITGLTTGTYSCTVTDASGCRLTKYAELQDAPSLSQVTTLKTSPTCFQNNGDMTFVIQGGTAPYRYQLSNGMSQVSYDTTVTFSNLSAGRYTLIVTDVGLCTLTINESLLSPASFSYLSTQVINSTCSYNNGQVRMNVFGGTPPYTFSISGSSGFTKSNTTTDTTFTYQYLESGNYTVSINDLSNLCEYTEVVTVENEPLFTFEVTTTDTTCGYNNGQVTAIVTSATTTGNTLYRYSLSNGSSTPLTSFSAYTFTGLSSGNYTLTIDNPPNNCLQTYDFQILPSSQPRVFLTSTSCLDGSSGTISALIQEIDGPYNLTWSGPVNGQTGIYITGLTPNVYSLTVSGQSGCEYIASTDVTCQQPVQVFRFSFTTDPTVSTSALTNEFTFLKNIMYSGYSQFASNGENCSLQSAFWSFNIQIDDTQYVMPFYYSTSLNDLPTQEKYTELLRTAILSIPGIIDCIIDITTNTVSIQSETVNGVEIYEDSTFVVDILVNYDIRCISYNGLVC
jgi:hypothetical protein